ncbi:MAG TPA: DUF6748 domain-containing protein [Myxococcus sp.]|jgi:hypothetical protein|nr:DUF6748 domain-containing protein [Myxococcus sp.]
MNIRPLLLAALALGFAAGCSKPPSSSAPPASEPGTAAAPAEAARPAENAPPPGEPGTAAPAPNAEARPGASTVYTVRDSGIRCIAPPCPQYLATPVNNPDAEPIQVHELELSAVSGGSDERAAELMQQATMADGIRLEGTLETRANAGPAGAATVLRAKKLH